MWGWGKEGIGIREYTDHDGEVREGKMIKKREREQTILSCKQL